MRFQGAFTYFKARSWGSKMALFLTIDVRILSTSELMGQIRDGTEHAFLFHGALACPIMDSLQGNHGSLCLKVGTLLP
jgi:hypothetical protein